MVLEKIYSEEFLLARPKYGLLLGIAFAITGIFLALFLFRTDPALVAVGFISVLCIPLLNRMSEQSEERERYSLFFTWKELLRNNLRTVQFQLALFFGVFLVFAFFSIMLPSLAANHLFRQQLSAYIGNAIATTGHAFGTDLFLSLFSNNFKVLLLCFILAIIAGNGSIFIVVWNASVWGTVFGNLAKAAAAAVALDPFIIFLTVMGCVLPHTIIEALSYVVASVSGSVMSDALGREKGFSYTMSSILKHNLILLGVAILILVFGAGVETWVLQNVETYRLIINAAFGVG